MLVNSKWSAYHLHCKQVVTKCRQAISNLRRCRLLKSLLRLINSNSSSMRNFSSHKMSIKLIKVHQLSSQYCRSNSVDSIQQNPRKTKHIQRLIITWLITIISPYHQLLYKQLRRHIALSSSPRLETRVLLKQTRTVKESKRLKCTSLQKIKRIRHLTSRSSKCLTRSMI